MNKIRTIIIGASGYTGVELIRLLVNHPSVEVVALVAESNAGQPVDAIYPHLKPYGLPDLVKLDAVDLTSVDVAFCCLPHATSQEIIARLPSHLKIIDLSADFRLRDPAAYQQWYGKPHVALEQQQEAVYGLTEIYREEIAQARLVACPGCYPTSMLLPLLPLLQASVIEPQRLVVDAKSGITGAGRTAKTANLFAELNEDTRAYGLGGHRHIAEVEQELSIAAGCDVTATFTPHVVPMSRGILSTIYVDQVEGVEVATLKTVLQEYYRDEPFVQVMADGYVPTTRAVNSTNHCFINVFADRVPGRAVLVSVIDNLTKGSSGQAVQNMNIMFGLDETAGLQQVAVYP